VFEACRRTALTFKACTGATVAASTVRHTGGWAVQINGGNRDTVIGCDLYDLGEGGVSASGGDRDRLIPGGHVIEYNIVHDICQHTSDAGPLYACARDWSKRGTVIRHNLIHAAGDRIGPGDCNGIYLDDHTSGTLVYGNIVSQCGWSFAKAARLVHDPKRAASGTRFAEGSHDVRVMQPIRVKGGQKVTVNFQARGVLGNGDAP